MSGVTPAGFVAKTQQEIVDDIVAEERGEINANINVSSSAVFGQHNGIQSDKLAQVWEVASDVYSSFGIGAEGQALSQAVQMRGVYRLAGKKSLVTLSVELASGFTLPAGSVASVSGNASARYTTLASVNNPGAVTATFSVNAEAEFFGPTPGYAGTITVASSPTASPSGWVSVTNPLDATVGNFAEGDVPLRARFLRRLKQGGGAHEDAIVAAVEEVPGVIEARCFVNENSFTDSLGIPAHKMAVIVYDPTLTATPAAIAQAIWSSKAGGIGTTGPFTGNATDRAGDVRAINYDYAAIKPMYIHANIEVDTSLFPSDGATQVIQAIVAYGDANIGLTDDLIMSKLSSECFTVPGVKKVISIWQSELADPETTGSTSDYEAGILEVVDLDTSRTTVSVG